MSVQPENGPTGHREDPVSVSIENQVPIAVVIRLFIVGIGIVLLAMFSVFGFFVYTQAQQRNELNYTNCISGELRDGVIVSILETIPERERNQTIRDAIHTLEPEGETECFTPSSWWPW